MPFNALIPPLSQAQEQKMIKMMKKPAPTMEQIKKGCCGLLVSIVVLTCLVVYRNEIMSLFD